MFERLRRRLTLLCTAATGVILVAMALACLALSQGQLTRWNNEAYAKDSSGVLDTIRLQAASEGAVIDGAWLAQTEANGGFLVYIELSGIPLDRTVLLSGDSRAALVAAAKEAARRDHGVDLTEAPANRFNTKEASFRFTGPDGTPYRATVATIPAVKGWVGVILLRSMAEERAELGTQRLLFAIFTLVALALLALFAWIFIRFLMRPIEENRRKQTEFVAAASHELRSPLAVIHASLSALRGADAAEAEHFAELADGECMRMSRLVGDMLALANADNGSWTVRKGEVELETLVLNVCEGFERAAVEKGIHLTAKLPEAPLPRCCCDGERVAQVLTILVDNALAYTPSGGSVTVGVDAGFLITVADTGAGIPDGDKARIFERFYRADASRTSREHYGLGLCIAREIAELHHGKLYVEDNTPHGAVFTLRLS